ncbi:AcrR family transcriptional regulator [Bradyrhizobium sp. AZCC 2230]
MPASAYTRAKQPEQVRRALLDHAADIAMDHGVSGITVQAVAAAAGVTKGGLFHHFGSKQALIEGLFADLLARVDAEIDAAVKADPKPRGSFTRAYVNAVFTGKAFGFATPWAALSMVVVTDPSLRRLWNDWMKARLKRHRASDAAPRASDRASGRRRRLAVLRHDGTDPHERRFARRARPPDRANLSARVATTTGSVPA